MTRSIHSFNSADSAQSDWSAFSTPTAFLADEGAVAPPTPQSSGPLPHDAPATASNAAPPADDGVIMVDMTGDMDADEAGMLSLSAARTLTTVKTTASATTSSSLQTSYTSGAAGKYNVTVTFSGVTSTATGGWTTALQNTFIASANRISAMIVGDVPDVTINGKKVDDISITASLKAIDGVGGILGQAGPTALRSSSLLPATATMQFDSADAQSYLNAGLFDEIVTHEMLHSVGFGSIWSYKGLTSGMSFIGKNAVQAYNSLVDQYSAAHGGSLTLADGVTLTKDLVPLETHGGSGTAGSHWAENVFDSELMTGYIDTSSVNGSVADPLSTVTVASLKDLGYSTASTSPTDAYRFV